MVILVLLQLLLFASTGLSAEHDGPYLEGEVVPSSDRDKRACTVDDLVPLEGDGIDYNRLSGAWLGDDGGLVTPPYDCGCITLKASYFCPNLGTEGYPSWEPTTVSGGKCRTKSRGELAQEPFPQNFNVLFYGNSHLRQVFEGITCTSSSAIRSRRANLYDSSFEHEYVEIDADRPCRSCVKTFGHMRKVLARGECMTEEEATEGCRCDDDEGDFEYVNGAGFHYHFAHKEENKRIEDALSFAGTEFLNYDAVVANAGNEPRLEVSELLRTAGVLKELGVPLFWMSTYDGVGDVATWLPEEQAEFLASGARFLPVHKMLESFTYLTKGVVEEENYNPHYCLPGPPDEIGVLLLRMAWALHDERTSDEGEGEGGHPEEHGAGRRIRGR